MNIFEAIDATWPAHALHEAGPWLLREGKGGGKRVSAATARHDDWQTTDLAQAEAVHAALGQTPLFQLRPGEDRLDAALEERGYRVVDPVTLYDAPVARIATEPPPPVTCFAHWPPLAVQTEIWAGAGIGPGRIAVMERVSTRKCSILARLQDRVAGTAFVALAGKTAMLHALEVAPERRRQGCAVHIMRAAAFWAQDVGAERLSLVVTQANGPANGLYASLGMQVVGHYHYRMK